MSRGENVSLMIGFVGSAKECILPISYAFISLPILSVIASTTINFIFTITFTIKFLLQ